MWYYIVRVMVYFVAEVGYIFRKYPRGKGYRGYEEILEEANQIMILSKLFVKDATTIVKEEKTTVEDTIYHA